MTTNNFVRRYSYDGGIHFDPDGNYVRFEDYEQLRKDAARYRRLRDAGTQVLVEDYYIYLQGEKLDAALDE